VNSHDDTTVLAVLPSSKFPSCGLLESYSCSAETSGFNMRFDALRYYFTSISDRSAVFIWAIDKNSDKLKYSAFGMLFLMFWILTGRICKLNVIEKFLRSVTVSLFCWWWWKCQLLFL